MNENQRAKWEKIREKGILRYVFGFWVLPLGIFAPLFTKMFNIYMANPKLKVKILFQQIKTAISTKSALFVVGCIALSIIIGLVIWNINEKAYKSKI